MVTEAGPLYYAITVGGSAACFIWQMLTIDFDNGEQCWAGFKVSVASTVPMSIIQGIDRHFRLQANGTLVGFILWAGMLADYANTVDLGLW